MKYLKSLFILSIVILFLVGCTDPTYKVSFETGTSEEVAAKIVKGKGNTVPLPDVSREGYTFDGWFLDQAYTDKYENEVITDDITLYAKWIIKQYNVKFMNGNVEIKTEKVNHGEAATAPTNPTMEGYTFKIWDKAFNKVTSDLVVNAQFDKNSYIVKFMNGDTQIGEDQVVLYNENATAPTDPIKEGYQFISWDKAFINVKSDLTVNAIFELLTFEVKFVDYNGNQIGDIQTINYNENATAPTNPSRNGYTFKGWDKVFTNVKSDLVVTATYDVINYTIEYYDNTTKLTHTPATYTVDNTVKLTEFEKTNYVFAGWFKNADFSDEDIDVILSGTTENLTLYGKWVDKLTINYELNGGAFTWTADTITSATSGIDPYSTLPEIFMIDFYTYLKDNSLLQSSVVASSLQKTTWATFSANYIDPVAIYNHTTTNTSATTDGYSQFFYDTATGNDQTGELLTIEGGFFGTEPYKTKYFTLAKHIAYLHGMKYTVKFWGGANAKSLAGFVLDGYFYGTQGEGSDLFKKFRYAIPQSNLGYNIDGTNLKQYSLVYPNAFYGQGLTGILSHPSKNGYVFAGWYTTVDFSGEKLIATIPANATYAEKYYAKWVAVDQY